jgi:hypothetical protein
MGKKTTFKIKELRKLPRKKSNEIKQYNSVVLIPSGKKHDSGYALIYIIGLDNEQNPIEIAAACDDVHWITPDPTEHNLRNEMFYPSGVIHYWSNKYSFEIGVSLSSTYVKLIIKQNK